MDQLSLVQPVDRLGQGIVVAVALAADRRLDAGLGKPLGVSNADVRPTVGVMNQGIVALVTRLRLQKCVYEAPRSPS